jgi:sugar lactone lactonase YvrE
MPVQLKFDAAGHLWIADFGNGTLSEFTAGATGNVSPIATLSSSAFLAPRGLSFDPLGFMHVADGDANAIFQFAAGAHGSVTALSTITGTKTQFNQPVSLATDPAGRTYVANFSGSSILAYNYGATTRSPSTRSAPAAAPLPSSRSAAARPA